MRMLKKSDLLASYKPPAIVSVSFSFLMRFRGPFSTVVHTNMICMSFCFNPLSQEFSNRCVFDENAQRINVHERPKRIEMFAFSNENVLVWGHSVFKKTVD